MSLNYKVTHILDAGRSVSGCYEAYEGTAAFSEIETKTLSEYITSVSDKLFAYISLHSYFEKLMYPYGYTFKRVNNVAEQVILIF